MGGSEGQNATAILVGTKERYKAILFKLFKRLLSVAIHNTMVMYHLLPHIKNIGSLKFRLSLAQGLVEKHGSGAPRPIHDCPSIELLSERLRESNFAEHIPALERRRNLKKKCVVFASIQSSVNAGLY
jgi:hypothetical protein